jgi:hypothetical protein
MSNELSPVDITAIPQLAQLVDEVERTRLPQRLRRGSKDVAVLMPAPSAEDERSDAPLPLLRPLSGVELTEMVPGKYVQPDAQAGYASHLTQRYPDVDALAGAAGSLPTPLSWEEIQAIVAEERAAAYRARQR